MRTISTSRFTSTDFSDTIQRLIDAKPSTAVVYRPQRNTSQGTPTGLTQVSTFQCRIDSYRPIFSRGADKVSEVGISTQRYYLLLIRVGTDVQGNTIDIKDQDTVRVDGVSYRCINVVTYGTNKIEAILNITG